MKTDLEILDVIAVELKSTDHPRFTDNMIEFYAHLVSRVPEDGFEQILDDNALTVEQEGAILQLQKYGYVDRKMRGIGRGSVEHHVDLRGPRFFEIANQHAAGPQIELPLGCYNPLPLVAGLDEQKHLSRTAANGKYFRPEP